MKRYVVGQNVKKIGSYEWAGVVCSAFETPDGKERYVVGHPVDEGWVLHIYGTHNLEAIG